MSHLYRDRLNSGAFLPLRETRTPGRACRSRRSRQSLRGGFTLIEVVIALAIFVIGAVAIVRIFTPALGVIQNSGTRTVAMRSAQSALARTSTPQYSEPDWIYDGEPQNLATTSPLYERTWNDLNLTFNGTVNKGRSLPNEPYPTAVGTSALGKFKRIEGERQPVLSADGKLFVLTNFPYVTPTATVTPYNSTAGVEVYTEDSINGVRVTPDGTLDFSNASRASDGSPFYDTRTPFATYGNRPPDTVRGKHNIYYITYSWVENYTVGSVVEPTNAVVDEPYIFHPDVAGVSFDPNASGKVLQGRLGKHVVAGVVSVRLLELRAVAGLDKTDSGTSVLTQDDNFSGIATISGGALTPGTTVYLSYNVLDWGLLINDSVPSRGSVAQNRTLTLPTPFDTDQDVWVRTVLYPGFSNYTSPAPTPLPALKRAYWDGISNSKQGAAKDSIVKIEQKKSQIEFDVTGITAPTVRTTYRGQDGWAQQLSVAPRSYVPYYEGLFTNSAAGDQNNHPGNAPRQPWREYYWNPSEPGLIYFRASEAGKTVLVTFINASSGRRESNTFTIDDDIIDAPGGFADTTSVTSLTLIGSDGEPADAAGILGIQGMSVQARTAWIEGGRYTQAVATGYRK